MPATGTPAEASPETPLGFQELIFRLQDFWARQGCIVEQPCDLEMGAGTFHPATFLRALGPEPWHAAYVQPVRRPADGRYGDNPNRLQHYYQFQVLLKPSPERFQEVYLDSLRALGIDPLRHDIRFVEDNWESPTLGAWGLGWEVWLDAMEITQVTYFQQVGGLKCLPVSGEITYGLERIAMHLQDKDSVYDLVWAARAGAGAVRYGELHRQAEAEMSACNFEHARSERLRRWFQDCRDECERLAAAGLALPAYHAVVRASHLFNLLDACRALSVTERQRFILEIRQLAHTVAKTHLRAREALGFPLLGKEGGAAA